MFIDTSERVEVECPACDDSGWMTKSCDGTRDVICGRRRRHLPHSFAEPCPCRPINRTYQQKQASQRRIA